MLDLSKDFNRIDNEHIKNTLNSLPIPKQLINLVATLATKKLNENRNQQKQIKEMNLLCGAAEGSPLPPTIFNACQDFTLKQISDSDVAFTYGFELSPELTKKTALAFADDITIFAKDKKALLQ